MLNEVRRKPEKPRISPQGKGFGCKGLRIEAWGETREEALRDWLDNLFDEDQWVRSWIVEASQHRPQIR